MVGRTLAGLLVLGSSLIGAPAAVYAHPLHTTIAELAEDRSHGTVRATIRVFADDLGAALARNAGGRAPSPGVAWDAAATAYTASAFSFINPAGRRLTARSCGIRRTADMLWICIESASPDGLAAMRVHSAMLCDLFADQVNIVQATVGGARKSLLFTRGDKAKRVFS